MTLKQEIFLADSLPLTVGPYHPSLPGPLRLHLRLDGNVVISAATECGFLHRGIEKAVEMHLWSSASCYVGRVDPEAAVFYELAFCLAVETVGGIEPSARATRIRTLVCELGRISSHLGFLARLARACHAETFFHYVSRDRERILDLFELLTGSRFAYGFVRIGGVSADVTDGFIERVSEACDLLSFRVREYNDLFSYNHAFLSRSKGLGVCTREDAEKAGVSGPNLRASGGVGDIRFQGNFLDYRQLDLEQPVRNEDDVRGDVFSRYLIRIREIQQSVEILRRTLELFPDGAYRTGKVDRHFKVAQGESYSRVEGSRGRVACHIVSDGGLHPSRVHFAAPSESTINIVPSVLRGELIEDMGLILASLDFSVSEVDR